MKLLVLADIDDLQWKYGAGQADVMLSCGDVSDEVILQAAKSYACSLVLAVKGNHDTNSLFPQAIVDLHLQVLEHCGIVFGGMNGSWRYKPQGDFLYSQDKARALLAAFPAVDIFLSHNSPLGIHDRNDGVHVGFDALNAYIKRARPAILIHGHQHTNAETMVEETRIIGVYKYALIDAYQSGETSMI
jgi:Icc-related predicted phosphoesterase